MKKNKKGEKQIIVHKIKKENSYLAITAECTAIFLACFVVLGFACGLVYLALTSGVSPLNKTTTGWVLFTLSAIMTTATITKHISNSEPETIEEYEHLQMTEKEYRETKRNWGDQFIR